MNLKVVLAAIAAGLTGSVFADDAAAEYFWTGAQDAYWTNAANWEVNGQAATRAPGGCLVPTEDGGFVTNGVPEDTAVFGTVATGATTINLEGQWLIKNIVITNTLGAATPAYRFGTKDELDQYLKITGVSTFTVATGVTANQYIEKLCSFKEAGLGSDAHRMKFYNWSSGTLTYNGMRRITTYRKTDDMKPWGTNVGIECYGTGTIKMTGSLNYDQSSGIWLYGTGLFCTGDTSTSAGARFARFQSQDTMPAGAVRQIEVLSGGHINASYGGADGLYAYTDTHIYGAGDFLAKESYWGGGAAKANWGCLINVSAQKTLTMDCAIKRVGGANGNYMGSVAVTGGGTLVLNGNNDCIGDARLHSNNSVMKVNKIGLSGNYDGFNTNSCLGAGKSILYHDDNEKLAYIGSREETTDRDLVATNSASNITMIFANEGTAAVSFNENAAVLQRFANRTATMKFDAVSAPIVFGGTFQAERTWKIQVAGTAGTSFSDVGDIPVTVLDGGHLDISDAYPYPANIVFAGNATVNVAAANDVELSSVPSGVDGKAVDFIVPADSSVTVTGSTGGSLANVKINGKTAKLDSNGKLVERTEAVWTSVTKGGNWSVATNWENETKPAANDAVTIANADGVSTTYKITLDEAPVIASIVEQEPAGGSRTIEGSETLTLGAGGYTLVTNTTVAKGSGDNAGCQPSVLSSVHLAASQRWLLGSVRGWNISNGNNMRAFYGDLSSGEDVVWSLFGYAGYRFGEGSSANFRGEAKVGCFVEFLGTNQFHRLGTKGITLYNRLLTDAEAVAAGTTRMAPSLTYVFNAGENEATVTTPIKLDINQTVTSGRSGWSYSYAPIAFAFPESNFAVDDPATLTLTGGISGTTSGLELLFAQAWGKDAPVTSAYNIFPDDQKIVIAGDGSKFTGGNVCTVTMIELAHKDALGPGNCRPINVGQDGYWGMNQINSIQGVMLRPGLSCSSGINGTYRADDNGIQCRQGFMLLGAAATPATAGATVATFSGAINSDSYLRYKPRLTAAEGMTAKFTGKFTVNVNRSTAQSEDRGPVYGYHMDILGPGDVELTNTGNIFDTNVCVRAGRLVLGADGVTGAKPVMLGGFAPTLANVKTVRCVCTDFSTPGYTQSNVDTYYGKRITWTSTPAASSLDGVTPEIGDYVLITRPRSHSLNGIWKVVSATVWERPEDIDENAEIEQLAGLRVKVAEGTRFGGKAFMLVTNQTYFRQSVRQWKIAEERFDNSYGAPQFHLEGDADADAAIVAGVAGTFTTAIEVTDNASEGASAVGTRDGVTAATFSGPIALAKSVTLAAAAGSTATFTGAISGAGDVIGGGKGVNDVTGATIGIDSTNGFKCASGTLKVAASQLTDRTLGWVRAKDATAATGDTTGLLSVDGALDLTGRTLSFANFKLARGDNRADRTWTIATATSITGTPAVTGLPTGWSFAVEGNALVLRYVQPGLMLRLK